jgi:hypothetical protein
MLFSCAAKTFGIMTKSCILFNRAAEVLTSFSRAAAQRKALELINKRNSD